MKKKAIIALTLGLVCALVGCQAELAEVTPTPEPSVSVTPAPTPTPTPTQWPTAEDIFPRNYCFGMAEWSTELNVAADGSFSGMFHELHHPDGRGGYPGEAMYICTFNGQFSTPEQVNGYTYSMKLERLEIEPAEVETVEETLVVPINQTSGMSGEEWLIYLPGAPLEELPEKFMWWVEDSMSIEDEDETLPRYGLYNVEEQAGFFEYANE